MFIDNDIKQLLLINLLSILPHHIITFTIHYLMQYFVHHFLDSRNDDAHNYLVGTPDKVLHNIKHKQLISHSHYWGH